MEKRKDIKKKPNKIFYTIGMILFFFVVQEIIIWRYGSSTILEAIVAYPQGNLVLVEAVLAGLCLILMLLFGNSYVFTEKKEKITTGLFYGLYYILGSLFFMTIYRDGFKEIMPLINILLGSFLIGVCEEFLCRGFLLNEFLERFGNDKKGIWFSIIVSGSIFGLMHIFNIFVGQPIIPTIGQTLAATGTGIVFGIIYYKTKNIWSVILLHALWDFSLFLGLIIPTTESIELIPTISVITILFTIIGALTELILLIPFKDITKKPNTAKLIVCSVVAIISFIVITGLSGIFSTKFGKTYKYDKIKIDNYLVIKDNITKYRIKEQNILIELSKDEDDNLILKNKYNNYYKKIECNDLIDYNIMETKDTYIISYVDYIDRLNTYLYYKEIPKNTIVNSNKFIESLGVNYSRYLLPERLRIFGLYDYDKDTRYLALYHQDYGMYLLNNNKLSILINY